MNSEALLGMVNNAALLLALALLYDTIPRLSRSSAGPIRILTGAILGLIGMAVMVNPWPLAPGVIFDTRSILLSLAGLFLYQNQTSKVFPSFQGIVFLSAMAELFAVRSVTAFPYATINSFN